MAPALPGEPPGNGDASSAAAAHEQALHRHLMRFGEAETLATPAWAARGTTVAEIEAKLAHLWSVTTAQQRDGEPLVTEKGLPHARASVLNLIATVSDAAAAGRVVATLTGLGVRHPSRAIVLVADPAARGDAIDAHVSTHCTLPDDEGDGICYEEVVLTIRGEAAEHLDGVVAPLLIHDLPTHVWWPGNPPFRHPVFDQLVEMGDRLIVDSSDFADLLLGARRLAGLRHRSGVGDLAWERLAPWQERTAQFFDAPRFRRYLPNLNRLIVRYAVAPAGGHPDEPDDVAPGVAAPMSQAILYAGWIASRLNWRRQRSEPSRAVGHLRLRLEGRYEMVDLFVEPIETDRLPVGELAAVHLQARGETGAAEFIIECHGDEATIATNADGMTALLRRVTMERSGEPELLSQQLIVDRHDPVYEAALRAAAVLLAAGRAEEPAA